jgi:spermidine synthase
LGFVFHSHAKDYLEGSVTVLRNFYGVLVVVEEDPEEPNGHLYRLRHGRTTHGLQFQTEDRRYLPTSYYGLNSGIGLALFQHPRRLAMGASKRNLRIGVVGLGVGTIAAYARAGDYLRYYEINPNVVGLSLGANSYFTYLKHCPGKVDVILGDARISMESELERNGPQGFDLLAIDAFNSDAIPVHLLTQQAMAVYLKHLRAPDGIVAIHISNRYLDLRPVVWGLADHFDLALAYIDSSAVGDLAWGSSWMLLAQNPKILQQPEIAKATTPRNLNDYHSRLWTDDYSNLFQILKK